MKIDFLIQRGIPLTVLTGLLVLGSGCKNPFVPAEQPAPAAQAAPAPTPQPTAPPVRNDQQIGSDIQAKIAAESALTGQNIQVNVANGVATLNGKVDNDASRALAAMLSTMSSNCPRSSRSGNARAPRFRSSWI